jgi:putative colanic acid biosynthesis glycosyltransferase
VIHFHNIHGYYLDLSIARTVGEIGIPVVWTLHDCWPLTGRCAYLFDCNRWRTGCGCCPDLRIYPKTYFDSSALMWQKKHELFSSIWNPVIATPSQWLASLVLEACEGQCHVEVIPNGIDTKVFQPRDRSQVREKLGLPYNKKVLLLAAADLRDKRKGAQYFFESLNYVEAEEWMVVTVGRTVEFPRAHRCRVDIKQLGYLCGSESMAEAYSAADLFCITSLDDNFPTTVLESMSCGTPVVGFSVGGIPEQVSDSCGRLIAPRDVRALGTAVTALLADDKLRRTMGERCREKAVREYDQKRFTERYLSLYYKLVEEGGS